MALATLVAVAAATSVLRCASSTLVILSPNNSETNDHALYLNADKTIPADGWIHPENMFDKMNAELLEWNRISAKLQWSVAVVERVDERYNLEVLEGRTAWRNQWCRVLRKTFSDGAGVHLHQLSTEHLRMIYLLCMGPEYTPSQSRELMILSEKMSRLYAETRVCRGPRYPSCYNIEPELDLLMRTSQDPAELLWAWLEWRNSIGPRARRLYPALIELQNQGAQNNGYSDIGVCWRNELETPDLESVVDNLFYEIRPLFRKLHTFVRIKLSAAYNFDPSTELIPAHLLGNMWAQNWESVMPLVANFSLDLEAGFQAKNYTVLDMVHHAEDFYISLGMDPLPTKFWSNSQMVKPRNGQNTSCHGTAANMYTGDDFRLLMCAQVTLEDFYVIHHEIGHIQYYMAYSNLPAIFQQGANSAFHEAVGDAVMLGVMSPHHLERLGILQHDISHQDLDIALLLRMALGKIPQLVFGLIVDKWRWKVMRGEITPSEYNRAWWELHSEYLGVSPPVLRSMYDFDPAAKFHIMDNTPYIRYFLSGFLQMQFFEAMCLATLPSRHPELPFPLHRCDIYGSEEAGKPLKDMMALGQSTDWPVVLMKLSDGRYPSYSAKPLLDYYRPLSQWLDRQISSQIPIKNVKKIP